ncbi:MAG TPA: RNA methyltransferase [Oscillospiraceae bacterium]|nr:RNA methyltransferase [Oscillospiraceae bacterium]
MPITSRENPMIKEAAALLKSKRAREENGLFLAEGARLCAEASRSSIAVRRLFLTEEAKEKYPDYLRDLIPAAADVQEITPPVAEKLSDTKTPQGVFAVCEFPENRADFDRDGLFVVLDGLQDPGNIGTILRTCDAMDVRGVLLCGSADIWSPKVLRASMGCLFRLPVAVFADAAEAFSALHRHGCTVFASTLSANSVPLNQVRFPKRSAVVIGNEGSGIPEEDLARSDTLVTIPMPGRAESLNAASAAAILIYSAAAGG